MDVPPPPLDLMIFQDIREKKALEVENFLSHEMPKKNTAK